MPEVDRRVRKRVAGLPGWVWWIWARRARGRGGDRSRRSRIARMVNIRDPGYGYYAVSISELAAYFVGRIVVLK